MNMRSVIQLLSLSMFFVGCATPHKLPENTPSANFYLSAEIKTSPTISRSIWALIHNEKCSDHEYGKNAGTNMEPGSPKNIRTEVIKVSAGKPLYFTAAYVDASASLNKTCYLTGVFTPKVNRSYEARMEVGNNVASCQLGVFDVSDGRGEKMDFDMPEYVCTGEKGPKIKNGRPQWIKWKVDLQ